MFLRRRLTAFAALSAAVAVAAPAAVAAGPAGDPVITGPSCPDGYSGPTNPATGCPYWLMSYTVQHPGQSPVRCPPDWTPPSSGKRIGVARAATADSAGRAAAACAGVASAS
jgi:hypothetical protein